MLKEISAKGRFDSLHNFRWMTMVTTGKDDSDGSTDQTMVKDLSHEDFLSLIVESTKEKEESYISIPEMPKGYFRGGITSDKKTFWVCLFVKAGKRQYVNGNIGKAYCLAYPSLVFFLKVKKGVCTERLCFAIKGDEISLNSELYRYPYGHVAAGGGICMGNCSNQVPSFAEAGDFLDSFFLGTDLGHYYMAGQWAKPNCSLSELVDKVDKKGKFPDNWLMKTGSNFKTVKDVVEHYEKTASRAKKWYD